MMGVVGSTGKVGLLALKTFLTFLAVNGADIRTQGHQPAAVAAPTLQGR